MKDILFQQAFFLQGAGILNVLMQIWRNFPVPLHDVLMFSVHSFSKRICRNSHYRNFYSLFIQ